MHVFSGKISSFPSVLIADWIYHVVVSVTYMNGFALLESGLLKNTSSLDDNILFTLWSDFEKKIAASA